jgi:hypothetical protein
MVEVLSGTRSEQNQKPYLYGSVSSRLAVSPIPADSCQIRGRVSRWSPDWPKATPQGRGLDAGGGRPTLGGRHGMRAVRSWVPSCEGSGTGVCGGGGRPALPRSARRLWSR